MAGLIMIRSTPITTLIARHMWPIWWIVWHIHKCLWRRLCMPTASSYDYAITRVVPSVERGECLNVGVILFCRTRRFLDMRIDFDPLRLLALAPTIDLEAVRNHLDTFILVCAGKPEAGYVAGLSQPERFHWLVAPRSTIIQISPV